MKEFAAPWGLTLRWSSFGLVAFAILISAATALLPRGIPASGAWLAAGSIPLILLCCLPFVVRSYTIAGDELLIRRLLWTTRLPLAGLKSAEALPRAMSGSLRTCGNGGGFSFTGWYWSKALGSYRAFVTDLNRTVVLRFEKRTVVVSPAEPEDFVRQLAPQPS
ncbi:PH domain-containing protein [Luteolibacter soli]|uniref:PH domain-containing protein n=1 Tax=Luteolibacter soli TaxID=3135280 RepID=A0ABU9ASJ0_9BACT